MANDKMHTDGIGSDGEVEGFIISTYYSPCKGILLADGYIRVIQDGPGHDIETRIDNDTLIAAGWTPPTGQNHDSGTGG